MSGIEIAGLIVGALPLMISAMEHYEETRRMTVTWWKIRRAHRRDLGRLRYCRLKFQLNMKDLLLPLVIDGIIKQDDCSTFLSSPSDPGWNRAEVQEALDDRLCDCRIRYLEVLGEMELAIKKLAKAAMVDDQKFQAFVNATRAVQEPPWVENEPSLIIDREEQEAPLIRKWAVSCYLPTITLSSNFEDWPTASRSRIEND